MKSGSFYIAYLIFLFPLTNLKAQSRSYPSFEVVSIPAKLKYQKQQLTAELKSAKQIEEVKKIIKSKNFAPAKILIKYYKDVKIYSWLTFNTGLKTETEDNHIVLQSRNSGSVNIYKLSDFKNLFRDTIALLDTLYLNLYLHDPNYPDDKFEFNTGCSSNRPFSGKIPVINNRLLIVPAVLTDCNDEPSEFIIYNAKNTNRQLASCKLYFLSAETVQIILDISEHLKQVEPDIDIKGIAANIEAYIFNNGMGKIYYPQLIELLNEINLK